MSNAKQNEMIITLSCRGEDLYSLNTKDFVEEISIGRNSDCTWSVGHVDSATSARHAMISKRKNDLYLTDLGSRNGIYHNERRIKEIKLLPGMFFHFGECTLATSDPAEKNTIKLKPCYLRYTDENGKRRKFKVTDGTVKIGSGSKCDLVLNSGLVSTPHVSLHRKKDGSCWIKDLNSRNGTSVNGLELPGKTERMLKNGDVISVADIDMTFYDGTAERHALRLTAALVTLLVTALACVGVYFFYLQFTPASHEFLQQARAAARNADFAGARRLVAHAATARKSSDTQNARKLLLSQIEAWENSSKRWERLNELLSNSRFSEVPQLLGTMDLEYISAWDWNENSAVTIKQELELYKKLFATFNRIEMLFSDREADPATLDIAYRRIKEAVDILSEQPQPGKQKLVIFAENVAHKISIIRSAYKAYRKQLELLRTSEKFDLAASVAELEKLKQTYPVAFIAGRVETLLPVLYSLQSSEKQMAESRKMFNEMLFKKCIAAPVAIPENKLLLAGLDRRIALLQEENRSLKSVAAQLDILKTGLERQGIKEGRDLEALSAFLNEKDLAKVFGCDSLALAPASKNRREPVGLYDKYLGVEYLYGSLVMIRSYDTVRSRYSVPFEPLIEKAAFSMGGIRYFKEYTSANCMRFITPGKLRDFISYLDSQLALRDRIVKDMKKRLASANKEQREYFIAHGIAYSIDPQGYTFAQREKIAKEFAAFRVKMQELNHQYNMGMPQEAIKIREKVLKTGLPGDPIVKRMWSLR